MEWYYRLLYRLAHRPALPIPAGWPEALRRDPPPDEHGYDHEWRCGWRPFRIEQPTLYVPTIGEKS